MNKQIKKIRHCEPEGRSNLLLTRLLRRPCGPPRNDVALLFLLFFCLFWTSFIAFAEEPAAQAGAEDPVYQEVRRLKALKESDPQAYAQAIQQKKENLSRRLNDLQQNRPENYQRFLARENQMKRRRLVEAQAKNPEMVRNYMNGRMERFKKMQERDPEKTKQFLAEHPQIRERMERVREMPRDKLPPPVQERGKANNSQNALNQERARLPQQQGVQKNFPRQGLQVPGQRTFQPAGPRAGLQPGGQKQQQPFRPNGPGQQGPQQFRPNAPAQGGPQPGRPANQPQGQRGGGPGPQGGGRRGNR